MNLEQQLQQLREQYRVLAEIDLVSWDDDYEKSTKWLMRLLQSLYRDDYEADQRIVFIHRHDYYVSDSRIGIILKNIQIQLNEVDISNSFAVVVSTDPNFEYAMQGITSMSADPVPITGIQITGEFQRRELERFPYNRREEYQYGSANPIKIDLASLDSREQFLLTQSKTFCIYPWIHMHVWPTGEAYPCCHAKPTPKFGSARHTTLAEIWNDQPYRELRQHMLSEQPHPSCAKCYEQEDSGFFSGRQSANKHHGHHIDRLKRTTADGHLDEFAMTYWDIRFSNLCNLRCRSCGHIFSSQWHKDQKKVPVINHWNMIRGESWPETPPWTMEEYEQLPESIKHEIVNNFGGELIHHLKIGQQLPVLHIAGRSETDMWQQLVPHLDSVEQIYFAGGEPLLMEEHYNILDELDRRGMYHVRLIYNTNFTHTDLKGRSVFDYWKKFRSVAVGASLDAMGPRAEYIRKGTDWAQVEQNRQDMLKICPEVDFYISPTLSIMNALHLPDFHRDWVERGLLGAQDLNVNILQDPVYFRIDVATAEYKQKIIQRYQEHLEWLRPQDSLRRATVGFESALNYLQATDNSHLLPQFWQRTHNLDAIRKEHILDAIPELQSMKSA